MDITQTHFELFGLPARFALDRAQLDATYRQVLAQVHPDRFAAAGATEQRVALQWSTRVNEAHRALADEVARARYLCELRDIGLEIETNTAMPKNFLMEQMEKREALEEAREAHDDQALRNIEEQLRSDRAKAVAEVALLLDGVGDSKGDAEHTAQAVRKLMFLDKFASDVDEALDQIDSV
jgi:molecular chaperone HscB